MSSSHKVSERGQGLPADSVQVSRQPGQIEVRIPLALLGIRCSFSPSA